MTLTEELESHPIFAVFLRQCALMAIGKWDPDVPLGAAFMREPHTGQLIYDECLADPGGWRDGL